MYGSRKSKFRPQWKLTKTSSTKFQQCFRKTLKYKLITKKKKKKRLKRSLNWGRVGHTAQWSNNKLSIFVKLCLLQHSLVRPERKYLVNLAFIILIHFVGVLHLKKPPTWSTVNPTFSLITNTLNVWRMNLSIIVTTPHAWLTEFGWGYFLLVV